MTTWTGTELPPPPDFFEAEKDLPALTRKDKRLDRIPLTPAHRRLRIVTASLAVVLAIALLAIAALSSMYRDQNSALTKCYAAVDASYWEAAALRAQYEDDAGSADGYRTQSRIALRVIGSPDIDAAKLSCDAAWNGGRP